MTVLSPDLPSTSGLDARALERLEEMLVAVRRPPTDSDFEALRTPFVFNGPSQSRLAIERHNRVVLWLRGRSATVPLVLRRSVAEELRMWLLPTVTDVQLSTRVEADRRGILRALEATATRPPTAPLVDQARSGTVGVGLVLVGVLGAYALFRSRR